MPKMTTDEVISRLRDESSKAIGAHEGKLSESVEKLNEYYHGKPYGNEVEGRSKFVTREVYETVESIMPYMVKVFFSADQAVVFDPEDEDDIKSSEQETEYVNWVFYRDNPGFEIGYSWIKDGLLNKVGYVKLTREIPEPTVKHYENQTQEQLQILAAEADPDFEGNVRIEEQDNGLFNVDIEELTGPERTRITNIPPEEFRISEGDIDPHEARYVSHQAMRSISSIRAMGVDIDDDIEDGGDDSTTVLKTDRSVEDRTPMADGIDLGSSREVLLKEEYIRIDRNDDGLEELWMFLRVGDEILLDEQVEEVPYYHWSPIIVPHRHHGSTPADPVMDIQLLKSKVTRNLLDNQERINNGRFAVIDGQVNLDDLMNSTPAGIVRQNFAGAVQDLPTPALDRSAFDVLGLADSWAEKRTGVSERGQGLDPRQFNSNTAASTSELVMSAAEQKQELIARIFAETGLKKLMLGIQRLGLKHEHPDKKIRNSNGEFIPINPNEWRSRYNMNVTVGIGNGSKNQQMFQMQMIEQTIQSIVGAGGLGTIIKPSNVFNFAMEKTRVAGRKDGGKFFTAPESEDIDQGPSVEEQAKMAEVQLKQEEVRVKAMEAETRQAKLLLEERKTALEERTLEFKMQEHEDDNEFRLLEAQIEIKQQRAAKLGNGD